MRLFRPTFAASLALMLLSACAPPRQPPALRAPALPAAEISARIPRDWRFPVDTAPVVSERGIVVTDSRLATDVGVDILERGGNATDAAVAIAFALAAVYPEAGNLGGGGFYLLRRASGEVAALDFRERAPAAATHDMFLDSLGQPTDRSLVGHLASGVPGSVAGLWEAHRKYGKLPWSTLVAPAIAFAEQGFVVDARFAATVRNDSARMSRFAGSRELFLPGGRPVEEGSTWRNPDLAAVLRRIAEHGRDGFYKGETAELVAAEMKRGGGLITEADLAAYQPAWREPVETRYRGYQVLSMPPASSGGLTLALALNILEGYDLRGMGWHSAAMLHVVSEALKRAFADRNALLADPDFVDVPADQFLSKEYAASLRRGISPDRATPSAAVRAGGAAHEGNHTTHFGVVDAEGNAVALTTTINELYGSAVTVSGAGFLLNDEMDDFAAKPGTPNMFGLVQLEANAVAPGKRMLSAMTPTIVVDPDGQPVLVTGARGGPRIISAVLQVILNVVDYGMDVTAAVRAPRIHDQHLPDRSYYERGGFREVQLDSLRAMGHTLEATGGVANAPTLLFRDGRWRASPDPRDAGVAKAMR